MLMSDLESEYITLDRNYKGVYQGDYIVLDRHDKIHIAQKVINKFGWTKCGKEIWVCDLVDNTNLKPKCKRCFKPTLQTNGDAE